MYADITEDGELIIYPASEIERYAFKRWLEDWNGKDKKTPVMRMSRNGERSRAR